MNNTTLNHDYLITCFGKPAKVHKGLDAIVHRFYMKIKRLFINHQYYQKRALKVVAYESYFSQLSNESLQKELLDFKSARKAKPNTSLVERNKHIAAIVEAAFRILGKRAYPVQITATLALQDNNITEMATGEGKSLTAALASVYIAWSGKPFHLLTSNDYLAERDAIEFAEFYNFCGLSVDFVTGEMDNERRKKSYAADITYTTAKEVAADLLRDQIALGEYTSFQKRNLWITFSPSLTRIPKTSNTVLRGLHSVLIDEADSVMIDDAVTPLIISKKSDEYDFKEICETMYSIALKLFEDTHYIIHRNLNEIELKTEGMEFLKSELHKLPTLIQRFGHATEFLKQSLVAKELYIKDKQYVIQEDKIVLVDEATGRLMPNRSLSAGLHQLIETKENVEITQPNETIARISFQKFFRLYEKKSGMTGTAVEAIDEFWHLFNLHVIKIPNHRKPKRIIYTPQFYVTEQDKWTHVIHEIKQVHSTSRPILVGTKSVLTSQHLSHLLQKENLNHNVLNALLHREEAQIIAQAGNQNMITVSTNMAGRGTDIKLPELIKSCGGMHVIATEFHDSTRTDRQLYGRCGRQGDPGSVIHFYSLDEEGIIRYTTSFERNIVKYSIRSRLFISNQLGKLLITLAQNRAMKQAFRQRQNVLESDSWLADSLSFGQGEL